MGILQIRMSISKIRVVASGWFRDIMVITLFLSIHYDIFIVFHKYSKVSYINMIVLQSNIFGKEILFCRTGFIHRSLKIYQFKCTYILC